MTRTSYKQSYIYKRYSPVIVVLLCKKAEVHDGEADKLLAEDDVLEVFLVEKSVAHPHLPERLAPADLWPDARSVPSLDWFSQPVVPVGPGPLHTQLGPSLAKTSPRLDIRICDY